MLDSKEKESIKLIVEFLMETQEKFTLFDITLRLQKEFGWTYKHKEIKKDIKKIIVDVNFDQSYNYSSCFFEIKDGVFAKLFLPIGTNPNDYKSIHINDITIVKTDNRGRITIPAKYIRQLSYNEVTVSIDNNEIIVDTNNPNGKIYKVDCYYNMKISKKLLEKIGDFTEYLITMKGSKIFISNIN